MSSFRKSLHQSLQDYHVEAFLTLVFQAIYIISFQNFIARAFTELTGQLKHCLC